MIAPRAHAPAADSDVAGLPVEGARARTGDARWRHPLVFTRRVLIVALVALVSAPVAGFATADPSTAADAAGLSDHLTDDEAFEKTECVVDVPPEHEDRVICGYLTVPERRGDGADPERTLRLPLAYIESASDDPQPDPLVFPTAGGPGAGSLSSLWLFLDYADWVGDRDVIVIEQRGDLLADPSLDCPEVGAEHFIADGELIQDADGQRYLTRLQACRDRLVEAGVDLSAYTSAASVADLADLRRVIGYDQWNLYGVSYGARVALTAMRDQPAGLRSVVLDGADPPNVDLHESVAAGFSGAVDAVAAACAADDDCAERYPDFEATLGSLLDDAAATPLVVDVKSPLDRSPVKIDITDTDITGGLFNALYDAQLVRVLPFLVDRLADGHTDAAAPLAQRNLDFQAGNAEGLALSVDCAEELPFNDDALIAASYEGDPLLAHFRFNPYVRDECAVWGVPALSAAENEPVASSIPTLLLVGAYDPITPRAWSELAASTLSRHYLYEFPTLGHGTLWTPWADDCPATIAQQFLVDPETAPDGSCIAATPPTDFLTTADIDPTTAVYRLNSDVLQDRDPVQIGILAVTLLVFATTVVYGIVYGLVWLGRRRGSAPEGAVLTATTAAGLNLGFAAGLAAVLVNTDPLVLGFGLPAGVWPLLIVPFVALAAAVLLVVLLVRAWMAGDGSAGHRVFLSLSALASIGFAVWLLARGLLTL